MVTTQETETLSLRLSSVRKWVGQGGLVSVVTGAHMAGPQGTCCLVLEGSILSLSKMLFQNHLRTKGSEEEVVYFSAMIT